MRMMSPAGCPHGLTGEEGVGGHNARQVGLKRNGAVQVQQPAGGASADDLAASTSVLMDALAGVADVGVAIMLAEQGGGGRGG